MTRETKIYLLTGCFKREAEGGVSGHDDASVRGPIEVQVTKESEKGKQNFKSKRREARD
jgi:hypothetical protein